MSILKPPSLACPETEAGAPRTLPFKQIVIAAGDGAKAALSAFDHLTRH